MKRDYQADGDQRAGRRTKVGGNLLLMVTALIWGFAFSSQKIAGEHLSPACVNCIRFLLGALVLIPALYLFDRARGNGRRLVSKKNPHLLDLTKAELLAGLLGGVVLATATTLQQYSLLEATAGEASFLTALYVVFVPFFGLLRRKMAAPNVWVSVAIALVGAYLLTSGDAGGFALRTSDVLLLLAAIVFALHITIIDLFAGRVDGVRMSMVQFTVAGLICLPLTFLSPLPSSADLLAALPSLCYLGICSCGVAYTLQIVGQQISRTPTVAALIMSLESVFGLLGGVLFFGDTMTRYQAIGCAVIFLAVVLSQLPFDRWFRRRRAMGDAEEAPHDPQP
jgi:drug/metabolite transporter (DMT)-like permease